MFSHKAVVETNDPQNTKVVLEAAGYTGIDVSIHPPRLDLGDIVQGRECIARCFVTFKGDRGGFEVEEVTTTLVGAEVHTYSGNTPQLAQDKSIAPGTPTNLPLSGNVRMIQIAITPLDNAGEKLEGAITIHTNIKGFEQLSVPVVAHIGLPIKAYPSILSFGVFGRICG